MMQIDIELNLIQIDFELSLLQIDVEPIFNMDRCRTQFTTDRY